MTINPSELAQNARAARFSASFAGLPFSVERYSRDGENATVEDVLLGRATSTRFVVAGRERFSLEGMLTLHDEGIPTDGQLRAVSRIEELSRRLRLFHTDQRSGLLIHPWFGPLDVIPESWSFSADARQLETHRFRAMFWSTELPPEPTGTGLIASTSADLVIEMADTGALFADEPAASAQLEALRPTLRVPEFVQNGDYTSAVSEKLLTDGNVETVNDIPTAVQAMGTAARAAESGELTRANRDGIVELVQLAATRHNSTTIWSQLEAWQLYLGQLGVAAFGKVVSRPLGRLQALPGDFDQLAQKNRDAIFHWSIAENARL